MTKLPILVLHGWTTDINSWSAMQKALQEQDLAITLLKIPGLTSPIVKPWAIKDYVDWLAKKVDEAGGKVIIIAHSNGGRIALRYAQTAPQTIEKLILIDAAGLPRTELKAKLKKKVFGSLAKYGKKLTTNPRAKQLLYKIARERDYVEADPIAKVTMVNLLESDNNFDTTKLIPVKSLILWGSDDQATPIKDAYILEHIIQPSTLRIVEGAGHSPHRSHTQVVAKQIAKFIGEKSE